MSSKKSAEIYIYETDFGDHYSVNMKDESGRTVHTQVANSITEARQVKERWESGRFEYLTES